MNRDEHSIILHIGLKRAFIASDVYTTTMPHDLRRPKVNHEVLTFHIELPMNGDDHQRLANFSYRTTYRIELAMPLELLDTHLGLRFLSYFNAPGNRQQLFLHMCGRIDQTFATLKSKDITSVTFCRLLE